MYNWIKWIKNSHIQEYLFAVFRKKNRQRVTRNPKILQLVSSLELKFSKLPSQNSLPRQVKMNQVESTLGEKKEAIQCASPQKWKFISNLFLVSKKDGDHRPVINLNSLNNFLSYHHLKMERLNVVKYLLQQNDYMCKIDYVGVSLICIPTRFSYPVFTLCVSMNYPKT